jgi:hypothetical protein
MPELCAAIDFIAWIATVAVAASNLIARIATVVSITATDFVAWIATVVTD